MQTYKPKKHQLEMTKRDYKIAKPDLEFIEEGEIGGFGSETTDGRESADEAEKERLYDAKDENIKKQESPPKTKAEEIILSDSDDFALNVNNSSPEKTPSKSI